MISQECKDVFKEYPVMHEVQTVAEVQVAQIVGQFVQVVLTRY